MPPLRKPIPWDWYRDRPFSDDDLRLLISWYKSSLVPDRLGRLQVKTSTLNLIWKPTGIDASKPVWVDNLLRHQSDSYIIDNCNFQQMLIVVQCWVSYCNLIWVSPEHRWPWIDLSSLSTGTVYTSFSWGKRFCSNNSYSAAELSPGAKICPGVFNLSSTGYTHIPGSAATATSSSLN